MSYVINSSDFQKLSGAGGGPVSMSDIVGALRLLNENIEYLKNFPDDKISIDMKEHLEIDREFLLVQAQHNIDSRKKKPANNDDNKAIDDDLSGGKTEH